MWYKHTRTCFTRVDQEHCMKSAATWANHTHESSPTWSICALHALDSELMFPTTLIFSIFSILPVLPSFANGKKHSSRKSDLPRQIRRHSGPQSCPLRYGHWRTPQFTTCMHVPISTTIQRTYVPFWHIRRIIVCDDREDMVATS